MTASDFKYSLDSRRKQSNIIGKLNGFSGTFPRMRNFPLFHTKDHFGPGTSVPEPFLAHTPG